MSEQTWVALMEYRPAVGSVFMPAPSFDGAQLDMLRVEAELQEAGIPAVFDPRRPGDEFTSESEPTLIRLMIPERDVPQAKRIMKALGV